MYGLLTWKLRLVKSGDRFWTARAFNGDLSLSAKLLQFILDLTAERQKRRQKKEVYKLLIFFIINSAKKKLTYKKKNNYQRHCT